MAKVVYEHKCSECGIVETEVLTVLPDYEVQRPCTPQGWHRVDNLDICPKHTITVEDARVPIADLDKFNTQLKLWFEDNYQNRSAEVVASCSAVESVLGRPLREVRIPSLPLGGSSESDLMEWCASQVVHALPDRTIRYFARVYPMVWKDNTPALEGGDGKDHYCLRARIFVME